ncbi:hemerythrin domain-containing protein [Vibrio alginolyticus]|uniref:hemerythrin domain-containing protein n=1 Tax=Vibrio alginolyticus TaxID=663 RepID=UPI000303CC51|nr:hemerythrin domain-containing protein [Vibrio alginolyticus]ELA8176875.1 hemerythrin domain-containing protein [Vibrio alginolyticus]ULF86652.1 hemerythrin domain-containing protein [Vibrio alginolyticus]
MMIERIRREHGYMVRLLAILRHKLNEIKKERVINYALVSEIVDYLSNHSEKVHHPKEDILYHHFLEHYGKQQTMENLEKEHLELASKTREFSSVIEMILQDAVVPQDMFVAHLEDFIESQRHHLELEERKILPLIEELFTTEDWQYVESLWSVSEDDPVFGDTIADRYKQLAERVRQSDTEYV